MWTEPMISIWCGVPILVLIYFIFELGNRREKIIRKSQYQIRTMIIIALLSELLFYFLAALGFFTDLVIIILFVIAAVALDYIFEDDYRTWNHG